jgi:putative Mg2+ transporter-C (MgtC) family protein
MSNLGFILAQESTIWQGYNDVLWGLMGNLYQVFPMPVAATILVVMSMICGTLVGRERRARHKPAGIRTVSLIAVGSTIFTIASLLLGEDTGADRGRIAAQVVTGVGFLGAGAIIREGMNVIGLTTGATIWVVAAIGVLIGAGYAVGGLVLTLLVLGMLYLLRSHDD